jgi:hypothetical protein
VGPLPSDPYQALQEIDAAVRAAGGYAITTEQSNLVLPQWGGTDGGTIRVAGDGASAEAELWRTGEGGPYSIVFAEGQTFFRRATCPTWARIPGGGPQVLNPFLISKNGLLANATATRWEGGALVTQTAALGEVKLEVSPVTRLPTSLTAVRTAANLGQLRWSFGGWGRPLSVRAPDTGGVDRGPGGNPC